MTEFYLVRHGQASFGAANYDKLSELGWQQAKWLGEYWRERGLTFDALWCGELVRHKETAQGIEQGMAVEHQRDYFAGLNEFEFASIVKAYVAANPHQQPPDGSDRRAYYRLLKFAMHAWAAGQLDEAQLSETWASFSSRVANVLTALQQSNLERVLVVSSGGAIAMMLSHILACPAESVIKMNLQMMNSAVSKGFCSSNSTYVNSFNHIGHLDTLERQHAITYS